MSFVWTNLHCNFTLRNFTFFPALILFIYTVGFHSSVFVLIFKLFWPKNNKYCRNILFGANWIVLVFRVDIIYSLQQGHRNWRTTKSAVWYSEKLQVVFQYIITQSKIKIFINILNVFLIQIIEFQNVSQAIWLECFLVVWT